MGHQTWLLPLPAKISLSPVNTVLGQVAMPEGLAHKDEFFGNSQIYTHDIQVPVTLKSTAPNASIKVSYQGCAAAGFCYPPKLGLFPCLRSRLTVSRYLLPQRQP